jgi:hypothetical protein
MFVKTLDVHFDDSDLDYIRENVLHFHNEHRQEILSKYDTGNTKHKPSLGYYLPQNKLTHTTRNVTSWTEFNDIEIDDYSISTIRMKISDIHYQNLYVVNANNKFSEEFNTVLNRILSKIPIEYDSESTTIAVQEFGYSMKFHTDAGVAARIHVTLNREPIDYFYTEGGPHKSKFGECCLFEASKTHHGFMSFQMEPRVHLILDINNV